MEKILIIGYGRLGKELAELLKHKYEIIAVKRTVTKEQDISLINADIKHLKSSDIPEVKYVFFFISADSRTIAAYQEAYVENLKHTIDILKLKNITRFFFSSSTSVYEQQLGQEVNENSPTQAQHFSGQTMLMAEKIITAANMPTTIVRLSGLYGVNANYLITKLQQQPFLYTHDYFSNRIHLKDAAAIFHHLMQKKHNKDIYIGTDNKPCKINTVLNWLTLQLQLTRPVEIIENNNSNNKKLCNNKIINSGFKFSYPSYKEGYQKIIKNILCKNYK